MKSRAFVFTFFLATVLAVSLPAADSIEQIISKARAYVGPESALKALSSIRFTGKLDGVERTPSPEDQTKFVDQNVQFPIEIIFQKPYQQRIVLTRPNVVETTSLDDYEGWQRRANPQNRDQWQLTLLEPHQIRRLRANTWENLNFFAGIEAVGGSVKIVGDADVDGKPATKLAFDHGSNIIFFRYFDKASGRLVKTETENGAEIREEGELLVDGIRFPKKVINKATNGQTTIITFEKAVLNDKIAKAEFEVPAFQSLSSK